MSGTMRKTSKKQHLGFGFGRRDRSLAWQLIADITEAGIGLGPALLTAAQIFEERRKPGIARRLKAIAHADDQGRFLETMARLAPGPEGALFTSLGKVGISQIFRSAAQILRVQQQITSAVTKAIAGPLAVFLLVFISVYFAGSTLFPTLSEITRFDQLDPLTRGFIAFALWFAAHPFVMFGALGCALAAIAISLPYYTGKARASLDNLPPYSLYRLATGSAFAMTLVECAKANQDIKSDFLKRMAARLDPYSKSRVRKIADAMQDAPIGQACLTHGQGFPSPELNAFWAALENRDDWEVPLGQFLNRWLEDVEESAKRAAAIVKVIMLACATLALGLIMNVVFAVVMAGVQGSL